jgi:hypothetical protein
MNRPANSTADQPSVDYWLAFSLRRSTVRGVHTSQKCAGTACLLIGATGLTAQPSSCKRVAPRSSSLSNGLYTATSHGGVV